MFCNKCGAQNPDGSVYCNKCGERIGFEGSDAPTSVSEGEQEVFSVGPTLIFVWTGYIAAAAAAVAFVALTAALMSFLYCLLIGICFMLVPGYMHLRRRLVRYTLTDTKVEIDVGFITQNARIVPLRSIQDVAVRSSLMQRVLGFGDIVIDNASEDGGKVVLKDIPTPKKYADLILSQLRNLHR